MLILTFATYLQRFFLSYPNNLFIAEELSKGFTWAIRLLLNLPFLFVLAYVVCILTVWILGSGLDSNINVKKSLKTSLRRYPHLVASSFVFGLIVLLSYLIPIRFIHYASLYLGLEMFGEVIFLSSTESGVSLFLMIIVALFSIYISIRLSLFYCFVVDGSNSIKSLKLSWVTTKSLWKDLLIIGLIFLVLGQILFSIQFESLSPELMFVCSFLEGFFSSVCMMGLFTSFAFIYVNRRDKKVL